jgi:hypothetical protein
VRVQEWAKHNRPGTIAVNGGNAQPLIPDTDSLHAVKVPAGTTKLARLVLPASIELSQRHGARRALEPWPAAVCERRLPRAYKRR